MRAKYVLPIVVLVSAVIAAWVVAGCGSDRVTRPNIPPGSKYPKLLNPYVVLDALQLAYQDRDTSEIRSCTTISTMGLPSTRQIRFRRSFISPRLTKWPTFRRSGAAAPSGAS